MRGTDSEELAFVDVERDPVQRPQLPILGEAQLEQLGVAVGDAERLRQLGYLDDDGLLEYPRARRSPLGGQAVVLEAERRALKGMLDVSLGHGVIGLRCSPANAQSLLGVFFFFFF